MNATKLFVLVVAAALVACGGESKPAESAAAPPPSAEVKAADTTVPEATTTTDEKSGDATAGAEAKPADAPATNDISGTWCGKKVADAASCKGDEALFIELQVNGDKVTGQWCEAFGKDCLPIAATSTFKGQKLEASYDIPKKGTVKASFELAADGTLAGQLEPPKAKAPVKKTLHKIK